MTASTIRKLLSAALLAITSIVIIFALIESWSALEAEKAVNLTYFFLISTTHFAFLVISARRLQLVVNAFSESKLSFLDWFKVFIYGRALNKVAPQLGHLYKGFTLKKTTSFPYEHYAASNLFYVWFDTVFNIITAIALILIFAETSPLLKNTTLILTAILFSAASIPLIGKLLENIRVTNPKLRIIKKSVQLYRFVHQNLSKDLIKRLVVLGIISNILFGTRIYLAFYLFGNILTIGDISVLFSLLKITNTITITPGNLGVQELSIGLISKLLGYGMATGISVMLTLRIYEYLMYILIWSGYTIKTKFMRTHNH